METKMPKMPKIDEKVFYRYVHTAWKFSEDAMKKMSNMLKSAFPKKPYDFVSPVFPAGYTMLDAMKEFLVYLDQNFHGHTVWIPGTMNTETKEENCYLLQVEGDKFYLLRVGNGYEAFFEYDYVNDPRNDLILVEYPSHKSGLVGADGEAFGEFSTRRTYVPGYTPFKEAAFKHYVKTHNI